MESARYYEPETYEPYYPDEPITVYEAEYTSPFVREAPRALKDEVFKALNQGGPHPPLCLLRGERIAGAFPRPRHHLRLLPAITPAGAQLDSHIVGAEAAILRMEREERDQCGERVIRRLRGMIAVLRVKRKRAKPSSQRILWRDE